MDAVITPEQLEAMLPPELSGIMGSAEYNDHRRQALSEILGKRTVCLRALSRLDPPHTADHYKARSDCELSFDRALRGFRAAAKALHADHRRMMHLPDPGAAKPGRLVFDLAPLKRNVRGPAAKAFLAKVLDHSRRQSRACGRLVELYGAVMNEWLKASCAGQVSDALTATKNMRERALEKAAAPFIAERKCLEAERAKLFDK